jgi:hypothetical protein
MARPSWRWLIPVAAILCGGRDVAGRLELGRALFAGDRSLSARMVGHAFDLPPAAVVCANCHRRWVCPVVGADGDAGDGAGAQGFGSPLTPERLTRAMRRRGGPSSFYDRARFCRVLREGIDPAFVMIAQTMPRYAMSDPECEAMWAFLLSPG